MTNDETLHLLQHLAAINKDAEAALRTAAENVKNSEIESLFIGHPKKHAKIPADLQPEIERLGGKPSESGTVGGAIERGWMDLKSALTGNSAAAMIASCENGELHAEVAYSDATKVHPTGTTRKLIEKHHEQILGFHKRLVRLSGETKDGVDFQKNE